MPATLTSRFPEIVIAIPLKVGAAIHHGVEQMANDAQAAAPEQPGGGDLKRSIEVRSGSFRFSGLSQFGMGGAMSLAALAGLPAVSRRGGMTAQAYGIWAAWYWFFSEYGTIHEAPRPWLTPAIEANTAPMLAEVDLALATL